MSQHVSASEATTREERFSIRAKHDEKALVDRAARAAGMTTSQFVIQAALRSAEEVLGNQTRFVLPPNQQAAFLAALDRPARAISELKAAALKPGQF